MYARSGRFCCSRPNRFACEIPADVKTLVLLVYPWEPDQMPDTAAGRRVSLLLCMHFHFGVLCDGMGRERTGHVIGNRPAETVRRKSVFGLNAGAFIYIQFVRTLFSIHAYINIQIRCKMNREVVHKRVLHLR